MTYIDKLPGNRRTYTLEKGKLIIEGKQWGGRAIRMEYNLDCVKAVPDEHRMMNSDLGTVYAFPGLLIFILGLVVGLNLNNFSSILFWSILFVGLAAIVGGYRLAGKMRILLFKNRNETPLFELVCRRRNQVAFDAFVTELKAEIAATALSELP